VTRWKLVAACVAAGAAAGLLAGWVATFFQPTLYRSETEFVAQHGSERTVHDLLESDIVTQVVIRNLSLNESSRRFDSRLHIRDDGSSVLRVGVDDPSQAKATQIAQELGVVFTQIVQDRFGHTVQVVVFDPAHDVGKVSPPLGADLGWGALIGALAGLLAANLWLRREPAVAPVRLDGSVPEMADALLARSAAEPFQTVLVAGADGERVAAGLADSMAARGQQALWVRSADASPQELARLAAHASFVFVAARSANHRLARKVDLVVALP